MDQLNYEIVSKKAYRTIGMKWEGSWKDITNLKGMIVTMSKRVGELSGAVDPYHQLGLSYHVKNGGFIHYSVYEVDDNQKIPEGMIEFLVPESTYLHVSQPKGKSIGQTYHDIFEWVLKSKYQLKLDSKIKYYDPLPIKHEIYMSGRDLNNPYFEIYIPIEEKN